MTRSHSYRIALLIAFVALSSLLFFIHLLSSPTTSYSNNQLISKQSVQESAFRSVSSSYSPSPSPSPPLSLSNICVLVLGSHVKLARLYSYVHSYKLSSPSLCVFAFTDGPSPPPSSPVESSGESAQAGFERMRLEYLRNEFPLTYPVATSSIFHHPLYREQLIPNTYHMRFPWLVVDFVNSEQFTEEVKWIICIDDDSILIPNNLLRLLHNYDWTREWMLGQTTETSYETSDLGYIPFGGAGVILSRSVAIGLAESIPSCLVKMKPFVGGGDQAIYLCAAELGVSLTLVPGLHQGDVTSSMVGFVEASSRTQPLVSLHHFPRNRLYRDKTSFQLEIAKEYEKQFSRYQQTIGGVGDKEMEFVFLELSDWLPIRRFLAAAQQFPDEFASQQVVYLTLSSFSPASSSSPPPPCPADSCSSTYTWSISHGYSIRIFSQWLPIAWIRRIEMTFKPLWNRDLLPERVDHDDSTCSQLDMLFEIRNNRPTCSHYNLFDYQPMTRLYEKHDKVEECKNSIILRTVERIGMVCSRRLGRTETPLRTVGGQGGQGRERRTRSVSEEDYEKMVEEMDNLTQLSDQLSSDSRAAGSVLPFLSLSEQDDWGDSVCVKQQRWGSGAIDVSRSAVLLCGNQLSQDWCVATLLCTDVLSPTVPLPPGSWHNLPSVHLQRCNTSVLSEQVIGEEMKELKEQKRQVTVPEEMRAGALIATNVICGRYID